MTPFDPTKPAMTDTEKIVRCAEIFGWIRCETAGSECWIDPAGLHTSTERIKFPNYLTDANAALELIDWMRKKGWDCDVHINKVGLVTVYLRHNQSKSCFLVEHSPTFCQAVTDAFLKANEHI